MPSIIRWLHLSDFHVGKDGYPERQMFTYIRDHVSQRKAGGFVPDFLFLSGDLAHAGQSDEFVEFWTGVGWPLQEVIGCGIEARTFAVPGNHDVSRKLNPAFSQEEIADARSHYLDPTPEGRQLRESMLIPRFRAFMEDGLTSAKGDHGSNSGAYAEVIEVNGIKVGVAGINTAWLSKNEQDERKLTPGKALLEQALGALTGA